MEIAVCPTIEFIYSESLPVSVAPLPFISSRPTDTPDEPFGDPEWGVESTEGQWTGDRGQLTEWSTDQQHQTVNLICLFHHLPLWVAVSVGVLLRGKC